MRKLWSPAKSYMEDFMLNLKALLPLIGGKDIPINNYHLLQLSIISPNLCCQRESHGRQMNEKYAKFIIILKLKFR